MSAIKKFFERKKLDKKFKKAGEGHLLTSPRQQPQQSPSRGAAVGGAARPPSQGQQRAADAALARLSSSQTAGPSNSRVTTSSIKAQARRQLAQEKQMMAEAARVSDGPKEVHLDSPQVMDACGGVFYTCPLIPDAMLPKKDMEDRIEEFLKTQLREDAEMASALLIHTANKNIAKVKTCIETLCKYIDNLIDHPGEEKFRKIRAGNKAFEERVGSVNGGPEFLLCAGYQLQRLPFQEGEDNFYVLSEADSVDGEKLNHLKEVLVNAEPIRPVLWRAPRLFHCPSSSGSRFGELPAEFYAISKEEIKREQQAREAAAEKLGMLRTKAMRERDEVKELRRYRYTLLRIRFPQDIYLQAIFKSNETLNSLLEYIKEQLEFEWLPFWVMDASGKKLTEGQRTLAELQLVPACVINFGCDKEMLAEAHQNSGKPRHVLQPSLLDRLENWSI